MNAQAYLRALATVRAQSEATAELSLREPLLGFVRGMADIHQRPGLLVAQEANAEQAGQPDVFVKEGPRLVGFVEAKAPGGNLRKLLRESKQMKRYRESLPNWVLTDHYEFIFLRDGKPVGPAIRLADPDQEVADATALASLTDAFGAFLDYSPPVLRSPARLATELARRARLLRSGLTFLLANEPEDGRLRGVLSFYQQTLMRDMTEEDFADTFAQTLVYGMFLGRLMNPHGEFSREGAVSAIPPSIPFLRSAVRLLGDTELLPPPVLRLLDDLAAVLENTKMGPIHEEVAAGGLERDLVVYFYESFLEQYDKGERKRRGVYYTPPELVGYLTRATQTVLKRDFCLERGVADSSVTLLDPAVGTGTFILGMAEEALGVEASRGTASQRRLIRDHLLKNFVGFELLPAPYAIAHLKLASYLEHFGYSLTDKERLSVYLTNSLELSEIGPGAQLGLPVVRGIVEEANEAGRVKSQTPVLVILGNPPYERTSHNSNPHSDHLIQDFFRINGNRIPDRNSAPIKDDYLRFIRWSVWKLLEQDGSPGHGVLAFVTNRRFLEGPLFRAARRFLLGRFDEITTFDLHGDQREWYGDRVDEKVFRDVQAGIALTVFVKRPGESGGDATVRYREQFGTRKQKFAACQQAALDDDAWQTLAPRDPLWLFVPYEVPDEYDAWPTAGQLFPRHVIGVQTHRDQLVVARSKHDLKKRLRRFADPAIPDRVWEEQGIKSSKDKAGWKLPAVRESVADSDVKNVFRWTYRPFDRRWIAWDERLIDRTRTVVSPHLVPPTKKNLALAFASGSLTDGPYALVSRSPVPAAVLSWRTFGQAYFAPLWIEEQTLETTDRVPNIAPGLLDALASQGIETDAEGLLHYVYAVLNSPRFRERYADGLRYLFPRIPIAADAGTFGSLRKAGRRLTALHLLEADDLEKAAPRLDGDDRAVIQQSVFDPANEELRLADDLCASPLRAQAWTYRQGSYPVIENWLEARAGTALSSDEFDEFRKIVAAVTLTVDELPALDELVQAATADALRHEDLGLSQTAAEE